MNGVKLNKILEEIERQTDYLFIYNQQVDIDKTVSVEALNRPVSDVLNQLFSNLGIQYKLEGSHIVLTPADKQEMATPLQTFTITGTVTDADGDPIIGANVRVKGSTKGTITDVNGSFFIEAHRGATVEVSYIGFLTHQLIVTQQQPLHIALKEDTKSLEEVVVVGYGVQKKINLTGAVASVSSRELAARPITSVEAGIQGLVPGLAITISQGRPGQDASTMRIRGTGTFNNSSPYILIDGVEAGSMSQLDPNDIESISVLKDAASASIYGSKAANGVILITTKRGQTGGMMLSYNGSAGWQRATGHIKRMHSADAATYYNKALEVSGKSPRFTKDDIELFRSGTDPYGHPNTDWNKLGYQGSGFMHQHNVNISGGNHNTYYMASVGYLDQKGILQHSNREQFNLRTNLDLKISEKLIVRTNMAYINNAYADPTNSYVGNGSDQIIRQLNVIAPWIPYKNSDGTYGTIGDGNPIAWLDLNQTLTRKIQNFSGILAVDYQLIDQLKLTAQGAYVSNVQTTNDFVKDIQYNPNKYHGPNRLNKRHYLWNRPSMDLLANYEQSFGRHNLKGLLGFKVEKYNYEELRVTRENFPNNELTDLNAGTSSTQTNEGFTRELALMSYFGRINYDFAGKYLFEANFRADASSRFSPENRWGYYPSFSAGWRISEEQFMENAQSWLQNLKVRSSWGQLGNQDALDDYYPWLVTYVIGSDYPFGGTLASGIVQTQQKLRTISWERSTTWGIGFDATLLACIDFSFDYYNRQTMGIIMDVPVPGSFGLNAYKDNVGAMRNSGVEITLGYQKRWNKWTFRANSNVAINRNEILDMGGVAQQIDASSSYLMNRIGQPYQAFYGYIAEGLFQSQEEADLYTQTYGNPFGKAKAFKAGDIRYRDIDGDGKLTANDRDVISSEQPKFTFGLNLSLSWKSLDASLLLQGAYGVSRYFNREVFGEFSGDDSHPATVWFDAWSEENPTGRFPRIVETEYTASYSNTVSSFWIFNTNYLRFKNIQIGYTLPAKWMKVMGISRARIYYSGENLFKIDNLPVNIDPEAPSGRGSHYPQMATNSIGINLNF